MNKIATSMLAMVASVVLISCDETVTQVGGGGSPGGGSPGGPSCSARHWDFQNLAAPDSIDGHIMLLTISEREELSPQHYAVTYYFKSFKVTPAVRYSPISSKLADAWGDLERRHTADIAWSGIEVQHNDDTNNNGDCIFIFLREVLGIYAGAFCCYNLDGIFSDKAVPILRDRDNLTWDYGERRRFNLSNAGGSFSLRRPGPLTSVAR